MVGGAVTAAMTDTSRTLLIADAPFSFASFLYLVKAADNYFTCFNDNVYVMPRDFDFDRARDTLRRC